MTQNKLGLFYFVFQLVLNVSWPYVFFTLKNIFYSLVIIILLFVFILLTIMQIKNTSRWASFLLIPYLLWVSFAAYLNWYIYKYSNN
jgi:benzodiazapine receptor